MRPYKKKRLGFEGVLIDIIEPNSRNGYSYGLIFGSVYAPNEHVEIDHAVIKVSKYDFNLITSYLNFECFKHYHFTAQIATYYKVAYFEGLSTKGEPYVEAKKENFMLQNLNAAKIEPITEPHLTQPTIYVNRRIDNIMLCKTSPVRHTKEQLLGIVANLPNDGSVEHFINTYTQSYQYTKVSEYDLINTLYSGEGNHRS